MEWISVKDRLPEHGKIVFVYENYPPATMFQAVAKPLIGCPYDVCEYGTYGAGFVNCKCILLKYVTHWMPLPKPPEPVNG